MTELELAEKLVTAKAAGSRAAHSYRLEEMTDCIRQSGASWGVADWDDVRDFIYLAGKVFAKQQRRELRAALRARTTGKES